MTNNNGIPFEVKKPFETVYEIKNEVPSFEEFMKTYEADESLNYADLSYSDIGDKGKGYGPCPSGCYYDSDKGAHVYYQTPNIQYAPGSCTCAFIPSRFCLNIKCYNWVGDGSSKYACSTSEALRYAHDLEDNNWHNAHVISDEVLRKCATLVREAVWHYDRGNRVKGYVKVEGRFWTSYEWSYSY